MDQVDARFGDQAGEPGDAIDGFEVHTIWVGLGRRRIDRINAQQAFDCRDWRIEVARGSERRPGDESTEEMLSKKRPFRPLVRHDLFNLAPFYQEGGDVVRAGALITSSSPPLRWATGSASCGLPTARRSRPDAVRGSPGGRPSAPSSRQRPTGRASQSSAGPAHGVGRRRERTDVAQTGLESGSGRPPRLSGVP